MNACLRFVVAAVLALPSACDGGSSGPGGGGSGGEGGTGGAAGGPFSSPVELSGPEHGDVAGAPALAVDGSGNGVGLFAAGGGLWAVRLAGEGGPAAPVRVVEDGLGTGPARVALAADGHGFAFWLDAEGGLTGAEYTAAAGFGPAQSSLPAFDRLAFTALDVDPEGDAVVGFAYYDASSGLWMLGHAIRDADAGWRPAEDWAIQRVAKPALAIARIEPYLSVAALWIDHRGRAWASSIDLDRRSGRLTQGSGFPLDPGAAGSDEDLRVAFDGAGQAHAVWRRVADDGEHVEVQRRGVDGQWATATELGKAAPGRVPALATREDGAGAAVAFVDEAGALRVARLDDAGWRADLVRGAAAPIGEVSLGFVTGGGLHVAFVEGPALLAMAWLPAAETWEAPVVVDDGVSSAPVLRTGGDAVHLVWLRTGDGGRTVVTAARR